MWDMLLRLLVVSGFRSRWKYTGLDALLCEAPSRSFLVFGPKN